MRGLVGAVVMLMGFTACKSSQPETISEVQPLREFAGNLLLRESYPMGCSMMMEQYCQELYSPESMGNIQLKTYGPSFSIYKGMTQNNFSMAYYFYAKAKLKKRKNLPKDFLKSLEDMNYFVLLREHIKRKPLALMTPEERVRDIRLGHQITSIWRTALEESLHRRLLKRNPKYAGLTEDLIPFEVRWERRSIRRELISQISAGLWKDDLNWKKVESSFSKIRHHMLQLISDLPLEDEVQKRWEEQILSVRLVPPGSLPEIADEECFTTESNAYYFYRYNLITVCAGDFNSEDIYQTLAHELAHSLDIESMNYRFKRNSRLGSSLRYLRLQSCGGSGLRCGDWNKFKGKFSELLEDWDDFSVDVPKFQQCLKRNKTSQSLDQETITRASRDEVNEVFSSLASENAFVRLTAKMIPLANGTWQENKNYLDICDSKYWKENKDPFDSNESALLFFINEYKCSEFKGPEKLKEALTVARNMLTRLEEKTLSMTKDLSNNSFLIRNGYASSPSERFADIVGSYALGRLLKEMPNLWHRRKLYLASSSWQCTRPSLAGEYQDESRIEKELTFGNYLSDKDRQIEHFSKPIREVLECTKDFQYDECSLFE